MDSLVIQPVGSPVHIVREIYLPWDAVLVVIGALILFTAWRSHRAVIMANCAAVGWYIGMYLVHWSLLATIAAALGGTLIGLFLVPLMRVAAIVAGAVTGCMAGLALWSIYHQPPDYRWIAAAIGLLILAVAGLYLFTVGVIVFCTLEGAVLAVLGSLGLLLNVGPSEWKPQLNRDIFHNPMNSIALIVGLSCLGLLFQYWRYSCAQEQRQEASHA